MDNPVSSLTSRWRQRRASSLSRAFREGDQKAAIKLRQRRLGYRSLETGMPWQERLVLALAARRRNSEQRLARERIGSALPAVAGIGTRFVKRQPFRFAAFSALLLCGCSPLLCACSPGAVGALASGAAVLGGQQ